MISFEVRVNGSVIVVINCANYGYAGPDDFCTYRWTSAEFSDRSEAIAVRKGTLLHSRKDGAVALCHAICAAALEEARNESCANRPKQPPD